MLNFEANYIQHQINYSLLYILAALIVNTGYSAE